VCIFWHLSASILDLALRREATVTFPSGTTGSKELDPGMLINLFGSLNRDLPYVYNWFGLVMEPLVFIVSRICRYCQELRKSVSSHSGKACIDDR
jgi:hypothetical protein